MISGRSGPCLSLCLIHPRPGPFTGDRGHPVRPGHERWRPVVNGGAQYSKACEGASLPWVQIPPPPPLTCKNTNLGSRQAGASCAPGLIYWSQLRAAYGPSARISPNCCAWSRTPWTVLNTSTHAAEACRRNPRAFAEYPQTRLAELVAALVADVVGRRQACRRSGGCQASPPGDVDHRRGAVVPLSQAGDTPLNLPPVRLDSFNAAGAGDRVDAAGHGIQLRRPESVAQSPGSVAQSLESVAVADARQPPSASSWIRRHIRRVTSFEEHPSDQ